MGKDCTSVDGNTLLGGYDNLTQWPKQGRENKGVDTQSQEPYLGGPAFWEPRDDGEKIESRSLEDSKNLFAKAANYHAKEHENQA